MHLSLLDQTLDQVSRRLVDEILREHRVHAVDLHLVCTLGDSYQQILGSSFADVTQPARRQFF